MKDLAVVGILRKYLAIHYAFVYVKLYQDAVSNNLLLLLYF